MKPDRIIYVHVSVSVGMTFFFYRNEMICVVLIERRQWMDWMDGWKAWSETWEKFMAINRWCHDDTSKNRNEIHKCEDVGSKFAKFGVDFRNFIFEKKLTCSSLVFWFSKIPQYLSGQNDWWNCGEATSDVIMIFAWFNVIISNALNGNKYL